MLESNLLKCLTLEFIKNLVCRSTTI